MKKHVFYILVVFLFLLMLSVNIRQMNKIKYPEGKDTIASFGDGTYQLGRIADRKVLINAKYHTGMFDQVNQVKQTKDKVYLIGSNVQAYAVDGETVKCHYTIYAVISLCDNTMQLFAEQEDPSGPDIRILYLDEMIKNNEVQRISKFTDFSNNDQMEFNEMLPDGSDG